MADSNPSGQETSARSPQSLRLEDVAKILTAIGPKPVTVEMLQADIDDGAPVNRDGTMNILQYTSWLVREILRETH